MALGDFVVEPDARKNADGDERKIRKVREEGFAGDDLFGEENEEFDPVDPAEEENVGGDVSGFGHLLREKKEGDDGAGGVGEGRGDAGEDADGLADFVVRSEGTFRSVDFFFDELKRDEGHSQSADGDVELARRKAVDELNAGEHADDHAGEKIAEVGRVPFAPETPERKTVSGD